MLKKLLLGLAGVVVVLPIIGGLTGIKMLQFRAMGAAMASQVEPPAPVNTFDVRQEELHPRVSSVGSVVAVQGITVSAEAEGVVRKIAFEAGSQVKAGDVLVQLDDDVEQAQLRAAEAAAEWSRVNLKRAQELFANHTNSKAELDQAEAAQKQAEAQVDNIRALIAKKTIRAPFSGRLGVRNISLGQWINKGQPIVSLQALDPVFVEFSLPQQQMANIAEGLRIVATTDAYPGEQFEGRITAVNPNIDASTRNVRVQATVPNSDGRLRPGMYVAVDMVLARTEKVLLIPETAVLYAPYGDSVYVVEEGNPGPDGKSTLTVRQQIVHLGDRHGDFVVVTDGLTEGQTVVSTAPFKLRQGMPVVIDNSLAPEFRLEPEPKNT